MVDGFDAAAFMVAGFDAAGFGAGFFDDGFAAADFGADFRVAFRAVERCPAVIPKHFLYVTMRAPTPI